MIWKNKKIKNIYVGCKMLVKKGDFMPRNMEEIVKLYLKHKLVIWNE
jgi:hypothetical protein